MFIKGVITMNKIPMRELNAEERTKNFDEVNLGYNEEEAIKEANRCLQCPNPLCETGCPVGIKIKDFIKEIKGKNFKKAAEIIKQDNYLPAVCGRVCPQETQCEAKCIMKNTPIAIGHLERFAADYEEKTETTIEKNNKKVAIIGSGPAGLTCAGELAKAGFEVSIYEAFHKPGGVLVFGIPSFRLPRKTVNKEIDYIKELGVKIVTNYVIGRTLSMKDLQKDFDAIFVSTGAGLPHFLGIPGENLNGVLTANEYLSRVNLMDANKFPEYKTPVKVGKHTVVIGGGNVAMDAARVAKRLGSKVTIVYRRTQNEMPARDEEIKHAIEEGIDITELTQPIEITGEKIVQGIKCIKMQLGEKDESGRCSVSKIENSEFEMECDVIIASVGQGLNPLFLRTTDIERGKKGVVIVNDNLETSIPCVYAGGDVVSGASTVINAMRDGKKAAKAIIEKLN